jgi:hypothetical protein
LAEINKVIQEKLKRFDEKTQSLCLAALEYSETAQPSVVAEMLRSNVRTLTKQENLREEENA